MRKRTLGFLLLMAYLSLSLSGCYYFSARNEMKSAEILTAELKQAGGLKHVPYEYTSAEKFLEVSKIEFGDNDFKSAYGFAARSKSAAQAGLAEVQKKK